MSRLEKKILSIFIISFVLLMVGVYMNVATAETSYCHTDGTNRTVCQTYRDNGSSKTDYWQNQPESNRSYKAATFDTETGDE